MMPEASAANKKELARGAVLDRWDLTDGDFISAVSCTNRGWGLPPGAVTSLGVVT